MTLTLIYDIIKQKEEGQDAMNTQFSLISPCVFSGSLNGITAAQACDLVSFIYLSKGSLSVSGGFPAINCPERSYVFIPSGSAFELNSRDALLVYLRFIALSGGKPV